MNTIAIGLEQLLWCKIQRGEIHLAVILCTKLCIAKQNLSIGVNVVCDGSPSRIFRVLLISLGITILPKSSTLLTMPVAFIYLSPLQMVQAPKAPLCKGGWQKSLIFDWGIVFVDILQSLRHGFAVPPPFTQGRLSPYNYFTNYDAIICKRQKIILSGACFIPYMIFTTYVTVVFSKVQRHTGKSSFQIHPFVIFL